MDERRELIMGMDDARFRAFIDDELRAGEARFAAHQEMLSQNTALTQTVANNTAEIIEAFVATKKGMKFFQRVGTFLNRLARWATPILIAGGAVWALFHGQAPRGGE